MKIKRLFLIGFYFVAGLVFAKEVTAFNRLGLATDSVGDSGPNPSPNWDTQSNS